MRLALVLPAGGACLVVLAVLVVLVFLVLRDNRSRWVGSATVEAGTAKTLELCDRTCFLVLVVVLVAFVVGFVVDGSNDVDTGRPNGRTKGADGARRCLDVFVECLEVLEVLEFLEVSAGTSSTIANVRFEVLNSKAIGWVTFLEATTGTPSCPQDCNTFFNLGSMLPLD